MVLPSPVRPVVPDLSMIELTVSIAAVMLVLSVIAAFSGLFTDPIQSMIGLHKYRLNKMINRLEKDVLHNTTGSFRPLDPFVARILEVFDAVKSNLVF